MNSSTPDDDDIRPSPRDGAWRQAWRRPVLRKIDALDARQVKTRPRHDAAHLS